MDDRMMVNQHIQPTEKTRPAQDNQAQKRAGEADVDFKEELQKKLDKKEQIEFSRHAQERLESRRINVTPRTLNKLTEGVEKAEEKGAQESLIMVEDTAYIVSVENRTVITAVDESNVKENVFTNIDSAVMM